MRISRARQFFDDLMREGYQGIQGLIGQNETEWLDFKQVSSSHSDNKGNWSEAIAGFANNQGGVVVWGVDCRKDPQTQIDCVGQLKPIASVGTFASQLRGLVKDAAEPPVSGVEVEVIEGGGGLGDGFVVCLIPESDYKPHRAFLQTGKPYKIRIGESFVDPSVSLLRSMFYPRSSPRISFSMRPDWRDYDSWTYDTLPIEFYLSVHNTGKLTAKEVYIHFQKTASFSFHATALCTYLDFGDHFGIELKKPVHPSQVIELGSIQVQCRRTNIATDGAPIARPQFRDMTFEIDFYSADMQHMPQTVKFGGNDLRFKTTVYGASSLPSDSNL